MANLTIFLLIFEYTSHGGWEIRMQSTNCIFYLIYNCFKSNWVFLPSFSLLASIFWIVFFKIQGGAGQGPILNHSGGGHSSIPPPLCLRLLRLVASPSNQDFYKTMFQELLFIPRLVILMFFPDFEIIKDVF